MIMVVRITPKLAVEKMLLKNHEADLKASLQCS